MFLVKHAEETKFGEICKVCPTCGLKESEINVYFSVHVTNCKLEMTPCDCDLTFKTPVDKQRHMQLKHSDRKYVQCPHCPALFAEEAKDSKGDKRRNGQAMGKDALSHHIKFAHGTGDAVHCEICGQGYKSENNLRVHRLNHELHFCEVCNVEILGRNPYKSHMMKEHGAGLKCDVRSCKRVFYAKKELEIHKKQAHTNSWKT